MTRCPDHFYLRVVAMGLIHKGLCTVVWPHNRAGRVSANRFHFIARQSPAEYLHIFAGAPYVPKRYMFLSP